MREKIYEKSNYKRKKGLKYSQKQRLYINLYISFPYIIANTCIMALFLI